MQMVSFIHSFLCLLASQRAGKKWSLEDDEEEEEEDSKAKTELVKQAEPVEEEMMEVVEEQEDEIDPLDAFMQVTIGNQNINRENFFLTFLCP